VNHNNSYLTTQTPHNTAIRDTAIATKGFPVLMMIMHIETQIAIRATGWGYTPSGPSRADRDVIPAKTLLHKGRFAAWGNP